MALVEADAASVHLYFPPRNTRSSTMRVTMITKGAHAAIARPTDT